MSEESAYPAEGLNPNEGVPPSNAGLPDLHSLFPSLGQDLEATAVTDLPLPVSETGVSVAPGPLPPPVSEEGPLASETASEGSDTNFGALMAHDSGSHGASESMPVILEKALKGHPAFQGGVQSGTSWMPL